MEFHSESNDQKTRKQNVCLSTQPKPRNKLGSMLNFENHETSYDDFQQVEKNVEKTQGHHKKQQVETEMLKSEELVKYMSYLPNYLERGENPKEKPFNIGVLDWRLLEKWQHYHEASSPSSFVASEGNSVSRHQHKINPPSQSSSRLNACSTQSSSPDTGNKLKHCRRNDSDLRGVPRTKSRHSETFNEQQQLPSCAFTDHEVFERHSKAVPHPSDIPRNTQSDLSKGENHTSLEANRNRSSAKLLGTEFTSHYTNEGGKTKESHVVQSCSKERRTNCPSDKDQTIQFPSRTSKQKNQEENNSGSKPRNLADNAAFQVKMGISETTKVRNPSPTRQLSFGIGKIGKSSTCDKSNTNCLSDENQKIRFPSIALISTSRRKNLDENNSGSNPRNVSDSETFQVKMGISETKKVRNPSPTRRLSFSIGRIGKSSSTNLPAVPNPASDSKATSAASCSTNSTCDKSNATGRDRSSPLRRLLDPFWKPKSGDVKSSERNPSMARTVKPSSGQKESPVSHSVRVKSDLKDCRTDDIMESHQNRPSTMQALLQVAVKNGLPLFTFTVDNCSDILAATVKDLGGKKTEQTWTYTFFSFSETKKKNAHWINQGSKDRNHSYVSNVVAQMKVSDLKRQREFVLSSLDRRNVDQTSDSMPCDEVAAIVVKYPDDEGNEFPSDQLTLTVILPGGHHGEPSKGEPSTLIERWKSGGSCDCGGWDLGCRIRVLANTNQSKSQRFNLTESQFKLFSQEEVEEIKPMFVLSPFEDGIFSVEFSSSLKLMQAFSCGIAVLNSKTSPNMSQGMMLSENSVSAKYVSYPPVSPVGRV
ncbi:hypothetical protein BUALT_Bualt02G0070600 [Buddleja alternifolia]|uniref:Uncharacterized protein n=1 Tax=Buddleja alternifolia TaxID=168488 RepID=A0AAV6XY79_9LAMI|nr:hypothetical protein BUALT_Bualt02G0070600 [Buddleja alternifolia]